VARLRVLSGVKFSQADNLFEGIASQDVAVEFSGQLNALAVALSKIANDLRWMNSGPLAGLGEIELPALQPGSSIMPGKVNPVIPEATAMVCAQVVGNHATISFAGAAGQLPAQRDAAGDRAEPAAVARTAGECLAPARRQASPASRCATTGSRRRWRATRSWSPRSIR
jgi:argininosuccinate lyase